MEYASRRFASILALVWLALLPAWPAAADPALWQAKGTAGVVHLFGTVHALRPGASWKTPSFRQAFEHSEELWVEIANPDDPAAGLLLHDLGLDPAHKLRDLLPPDSRTALDEAVAALGLPGGSASLDRFRPWAASLLLTVVPILKAGYDPQSGVDRELIYQARSFSKPVFGFETMAQQLHYFADLPQADQIAMLRNTLGDASEGAAVTDRLVAAWSSGDEAVLLAEGDKMKHDSPSLYKALIVDRNRRFADGIVKLLARPGSFFVAVGGLHLPGPDGIRALLVKRGIAVERE